MSALEESLAKTKALYPDIKIIEVKEFNDLFTLTEEEKAEGLANLVSYLFEESLNNLLKKEDKDWLSIQRHIDTIVKVKYNHTITPRENR